MLIAVRTVSETDDVRVIEGLAYPFKLRDTYGTHFSARTDFHWGLFPDVDPVSATRAGASPAFVRPVTYHHGFEPDFGLDRQGGWSPVRMDDDGVWVQAQIDKRQRYYATRIKPLLDAGALGLSGGSAEHSVRIDATGEIRDWPAYELALTPVESNPLAQLSVRAGETVAALRIVADRAADSTASIDDLPDSDFAYIEPGGKKDDAGKTTPRSLRHFPIQDAAHVRNALARLDQSEFGDKARAKVEAAAKKFDIDTAAKAGVRGIQTFSDIVAGAELSDELPEAFDTLTSAIYGAVYATDSDWNPLPLDDKRTAIQTSLDQFRDYVLGLIDSTTIGSTARAFLSAIRAGRRNSEADASALTTAHNSIAAVLGMDCAPGDASARSAEVLPGIRITADPERPDVALHEMATRAAETAAAEAVRRLTG